MLPLKLRILEYAIEANRPITISDLMQDLKGEYGGESQFNKKRVQNYFDSFLGIGFMKAERIEYDENGELLVYASVSETGKSRLKFIPGHQS